VPRQDIAPLTPEIVASGEWIIRITAIDPATGDDVPSVQISGASIAVNDIGGSQGAAAPFPLLVPFNP
jgi:hypothetical protein